MYLNSVNRKNAPILGTRAKKSKLCGFFSIMFLLLIISISSSNAQTSEYAIGPESLGQWDLGPDHSLAKTKCVVVDGNYAYVGVTGANQGKNGLYVLDISDPSDITEIGTGFLSNPNHIAFSIIKSGDYIFLGASSNIYVFNVSDPTDPVELTVVVAGSTVYGLDVCDDGDYLYVAAYSNSLTVFNITDPANSENVWGKDDHPEYNSRWTYDVKVKGNYAYCADSYGLHIYDITDRENPISIGRGEKSSASTAWGIAIYGTNRIILSQATGIIDMFDITDIENPVLAADYIDSTSDAFRVAISGDLLFVADATQGLVSMSLTTNSFSYGNIMDTDGSRGDWVVIEGDYVYYCGSDGFHIFNINDGIRADGDLMDEIPGFPTISLSIISISSILIGIRYINRKRQ